MPKAEKAVVVRKKKPKTDKSLVELAIEGINEAMDSDMAAMTLEDDENPIVGWVKTGVWAIDYIVSDFRGLPLGRAMNVWGPQGSCKSSLVQFFVKIFQDANILPIWFDYDDAMDKVIVTNRGVDLSKVVVPEIGTIEEGADCITGLIDKIYGKKQNLRKSKKIAEQEAAKLPKVAILWDSLWAALPQDMLGKSAGKASVGAEARAYSILFKRLRLQMRRRPIIAVFTNEEREKIGGMSSFGPQTKQPGGKAVYHYPTTVLKLSRVETVSKTVKGRDKKVGFIIEARADKARLAAMGRKVRFFVSFSKKPGRGGPDPVESNFMFLKDMNFLGSKKLDDGTPGYTIRGLDLPAFNRKTWPEFMAQHGKAIVGMMRTELCSDDDSPEKATE